MMEPRNNRIDVFHNDVHKTSFHSFGRAILNPFISGHFGLGGIHFHKYIYFSMHWLVDNCLDYF